jgi:DNA replication protein DnaC
VTTPDVAPVLLERDFPNSDRDPYYVRENIAIGETRVLKIPERYRDVVVSEPGVIDWVRAVVGAAAGGRTPSPVVVAGPSLLLLGPTGTGKTHQAFGAMRAISLSGVACKWVFSTAADIYGELRPRPRVDSEKEFDRYAKATLLVIDDLGAAKGSEWTEEVNYRLINHRYAHKLPTLFTSNVPPKDLGNALGERVASRLVEMTTRVVLKGADRRLPVPVLPAGSAAPVTEGHDR